MIRTVVAAAALISAPCAAWAQSESVEEAAARFGARQSLQYASLSPSGEKLAYVAPLGRHGEVVYVINLVGDPSPTVILHNADPMTDIDYCDWATEARLVCDASIINREGKLLIGFSRMVAVDATGGNIDLLTRTPRSVLGYHQDGGSILALDLAGRPNKILMTRDVIPQDDRGYSMGKQRTGLGVEEVDIDNRRTTRVEAPIEDAVRYVADENGRVRIMIRHVRDGRGNLSGRRVYSYRSKDSDTWRDLGESRSDAQAGTGFYPVAVDSARDVAFGFDSKDGFDALYSIALDGSGRREEVLARSDVDVDRLIRIGRRNRVVGASYATEKREVSYIDAELAEIAGRFAKALPGKPLIDIIDANADESKLLIVASSDTDPGMVYLYDKARRQIAELLPLRDELVGAQMGMMAPVSFPAADGTPIPGYLTLPPGVSEARGLPAIVMPHGGPSARDEWGFDWLVQFFASQGYAVLQPNYRGSSGYGSAWFGKNGYQAWETAVGDVNDAGRWLVAQGTADPAKLAIVGWSYGGYAALQSQVLDPALYKAVVAIAPVTDLDMLREEHRDFSSFAIVDRMIGRGGHVRAGSPAQNAAGFAAPVLLFHGTVDQNVGVEQSRRMEERLKRAGKRVTYVEFKELAHSLDDSEARTRMLAETARFLQGALGR